jgi:hypothetical protein
MSDQHRAWGIVALLLVILVVIANTMLVLDLRARIASLQQAQPHRPDLPRAAIPTQLILEDPACAQKLLTVINVTNVRILTDASQLPGLDDQITAPLRNLGCASPAPGEQRNRDSMNKTSRWQ